MGRHVAKIGRLGLQRCIFMPLSQWSDVRLPFSRRSEPVLIMPHSGERSRREQILAVHIGTYTFSSADSVMDPIRSNSHVQRHLCVLCREDCAGKIASKGESVLVVETDVSHLIVQIQPSTPEIPDTIFVRIGLHD